MASRSGTVIICVIGRHCFFVFIEIENTMSKCSSERQNKKLISYRNNGCNATKRSLKIIEVDFKILRKMI